MIAALIDLIRDGDLSPTVAAIADRAEVSHRSIFRYFEDLPDLARTAIETELANATPLSVIPDEGEGTFEHRVDQMIAAQLRVYERTHGLFRVAMARSIEIPDLDEGLSMVSHFRLARIMRQFAPEFEAMSEATREAIGVAVLLVLCPTGYDMQHRVQGRHPDEIGAAWRLALLKLLG
ncbi:MAG: TetR/AcrR family transcriptional regulator [Ilumatobacter sp.]